ncbi:MAG: AAA family ATPase, partial [Chitinophagaceae bacterium]
MQFNNEVEAVDALHQSFNKIQAEIGKVVIGQDE